MGIFTSKEVAAGRIPDTTAWTVEGPTCTHELLMAGVVVIFGSWVASTGAAKLSRTRGAFTASDGAVIDLMGATEALAALRGQHRPDEMSTPVRATPNLLPRMLLD